MNNQIIYKLLNSSIKEDNIIAVEILLDELKDFETINNYIRDNIRINRDSPHSYLCRTRNFRAYIGYGVIEIHKWNFK